MSSAAPLTDKRYGKCLANPAGTAYRTGYCCESVALAHDNTIFHQCSRRNGYGPDGLHCRQHAAKLAPQVLGKG